MSFAVGETQRWAMDRRLDYCHAGEKVEYTFLWVDSLEYTRPLDANSEVPVITVHILPYNIKPHIWTNGSRMETDINQEGFPISSFNLHTLYIILIK